MTSFTLTYKYPCSKTSILDFEQGHLSRKNLPRTIFASVNYLTSCTCQGKLVIFSISTTKENLSRKTCQGKLACVYSRHVFLDKCTCQGTLASVNHPLS